MAEGAEDGLGKLRDMRARSPSQLNRAATQRTLILEETGLEFLKTGQGHDSKPIEGQAFRCEITSGTWSHHTPLGAQAEKPRGYAASGGGKVRTHERPDRLPREDGFDPFDIDNTHVTPEAVLTVADPAAPERPLIRAFENKFPVLAQPDDEKGVTLQASFVDDLFPQVSAVGKHEVVVQHWQYNMCEALASEEEVKLLWQTLRTRFCALSEQSAFVQLMENHGVKSGGSLPHPHSQLLALPIVPGVQYQYYQVALDFWLRNGRSVFEAVMEKTLANAGADGGAAAGAPRVDRMLEANEHCVAFVPHAQERAHEIWVMPRRRIPSFGDASDEEVASLALLTRSVLRMLYAALDDPDYNIMLRNGPSRPSDAPGDTDEAPIADWYCWHLVIIPHGGGDWAGIKGYGGFSAIKGTPEEHAQQLRECAGVDIAAEPEPEPEAAPAEAEPPTSRRDQ